MILPFRGTLTDWASQWRRGLNFTQTPMELWYLINTKNALPRTMREPFARKLVAKSVCRGYCFVEKWSWKTMINANFQHLHPVVWSRHHNSLPYPKSCIRGTQCHQGALWRCGVLPACWFTGCTKLASRLAFSWQIGETDPAHLHVRTSLLSAFSC